MTELRFESKKAQAADLDRSPAYQIFWESTFFRIIWNFAWKKMTRSMRDMDGEKMPILTVSIMDIPANGILYIVWGCLWGLAVLLFSVH